MAEINGGDPITTYPSPGMIDPPSWWLSPFVKTKKPRANDYTLVLQDPSDFVYFGQVVRVYINTSWTGIWSTIGIIPKPEFTECFGLFWWHSLAFHHHFEVFPTPPLISVENLWSFVTSAQMNEGIDQKKHAVPLLREIRTKHGTNERGSVSSRSL